MIKGHDYLMLVSISTEVKSNFCSSNIIELHDHSLFGGKIQSPYLVPYAMRRAWLYKFYILVIRIYSTMGTCALHQYIHT